VTKVKSLGDCVALIKDGAVLALGTQTPMAFVRELIRQGKRNLVLYNLTGSLDVDMLCGADCVAEVRAFYVVLPTGQWAPNYKRAVESGKVFVCEETEASLILGAKAGALGLPLLALQNPHNDIVKLHPEWKSFKSPLTGEELLAMPPIVPDFALLHMPRADESGNIQAEDIFTYNKIFASWDHLISQAAKEVIVTVEEIVDSQKLREHPERTFIPFYDVDAVAHVPKGTHPCEMLGHHQLDQQHMQLYMEASEDDGSFQQYIDKFVRGVSGNDQYLAVVNNSKHEKEL